MMDDDNQSVDDQFSSVKGIVNGLLFGSVLWIIILCCLWLWWSK